MSVQCRPVTRARKAPIHLAMALLAAMTLLLATMLDPTPATAKSSDFPAGHTVVVATDLLNLRASPSLKGAVLHVMVQGEVMRVISGPVYADGYTWYELESWMGGPMAGWAAGEYLAHDTDDGNDGGPIFFQIGATVAVDAPRLNGRWGPGLGYGVDHVLLGGTPAVVIDGPVHADGYHWYQLQLQSGAIVWAIGEGLVASDGGWTPGYDIGDTATVATDALNLRGAAGLTAPVLLVLPGGTEVTVIGSPVLADGYTWYPVETSTGMSGWVAGEYLD